MYTKRIDLKAAESLMDRYAQAGGNVVTVYPGTLGLGCVVMYGGFLKAFVIEEMYVNEWSSRHSIKVYPDGILPKKYQKLAAEIF